MDNLAAEFKGLKTFATLSPAPGFRSWLDGQLNAGEEELLTAAEQKAIPAAGAKNGGLKAVLANSDWHRDDALSEAMRGPLMRLCARFLTREQRENGRAVDPVTHFHLSNGARIGRLCWMADRSPKGLHQSAGMMINYVYKLAEIEDNHEAYTSKGKIIANSAVRGLAKP